MPMMMLVIIFNFYLIAIVLSDPLQNNAAPVLPLQPNVPTFKLPTNLPTQNDPRQDIRNQIVSKLVANAAKLSVLKNSPQQNAPRTPDSSPTFDIVQTPIENPPACKNSEVLIKVLNNLLDVLKLQTSESKVETVNNQLDLIKKYMTETPKGLQNSELYNKFKIVQEDLEKYKLQLLNLKPKLRSVFDDDTTPKFQTKIVFKYQLPSIDQPDCKEAFMKLISIAHDAYLQLSKQPMCKGTASNQIVWPNYLIPQNQHQYESNNQAPPIPVPLPSQDTLQNQNMPNNQYLLDILKILYPKLSTSDSKIPVPNQINPLLNQNTVTVQNYQNPLNPNNPLYQNYPNFPNWNYQNPLPSQNNINRPFDQNNQSPLLDQNRLPNQNIQGPIPDENYVPLIFPNRNPLINKKPSLDQIYLNLQSPNYVGQKNQNFDPRVPIPSIPGANQETEHQVIDIMSILQNYRPSDNTSNLQQYFPSSSYFDKPLYVSRDPHLNSPNGQPLLIKNQNPLLYNVTGYNPFTEDFASYLKHADQIAKELKGSDSEPNNKGINQNKSPIFLNPININNPQLVIPSHPQTPLLINNQNPFQYDVTGYNPITGDFASYLKHADQIAKELKGSDSEPNNKGVNQNQSPIFFNPSNINNPQLVIPSYPQTYMPNLPSTNLLPQNNIPPQSWPKSNQGAYHHDSIVVTGPKPGIPKNNLQQTSLNQQQNYLTPTQFLLLKHLLGQKVPLDSPNQKPTIPSIDPYQQELLQNLIKRQILFGLQNQEPVIHPNQNSPNPLLIHSAHQEKGNNQNLDQYGISNWLMNQQQNNKPNQLQPSLLDLIGLSNQENISPVSQIPTVVGDIPSNFQQQANYAVGVDAADAKQWSSVTNQLKLNSLPDKPDIIELTYLLKRPEQFLYQYQPYLFVKYRLAYNTFLLNLRDLLARKPYLRTDPVKLYRELIPNSNITAVSPDLKNLNEDDIMKIVSQNSAFVDAKIVNSNNTILDEQLKAIQNLTSNLKNDEILDILDVMINNNVKNKESLEQLREGLNDTANKQLGNLKSNHYVETTAANKDIPAEIKKMVNEDNRRDAINTTDQYSLPEYVANPRLLHLKRSLQNETAVDIV